MVRGRTPPPPPPPPPELGQALLQMTQLLNQMQQTQQAFQQNHRVHADGNGRVTIRDFLQLNPRTFDTTLEPLDADDWLREVNRVLNTARVAQDDKVPFVTHLLRGDSAAWWENYQEMRAPE